MNLTDIVQKNKADKGLRFANFLIDTVLFYCFLFFIGLIIALVAIILNNDLTFLEDLYIHPIIDYLLTAIIRVFYYFGMEILTKGRSIGKFITGTQVVTLEGETPTANVFLKRSFCRIIPFEAFSFFGENGWHDSIPKTAVVVKKHFDYESNLSLDVDTIGKEIE
ncbi:RDD family protein [Paenimyroides baculatum]|uniref:RDD family protein n=1 Tax=Paenimyroides baculatum TaxID=2608000 RepID=A0A5M6CI49_9FLAO|nr:RDD family protein [Paenimyroides baculatum]KAA5534110.1 RDD family protein [Paenimyroides baculatum]